jgi:hypothetical protein
VQAAKVALAASPTVEPAEAVSLETVALQLAETAALLVQLVQQVAELAVVQATVELAEQVATQTRLP